MQFKTAPEVVGDLSSQRHENCSVISGVLKTIPYRVPMSFSLFAVLAMMVVSCSPCRGDQLQDLAEKVGIRILASGDSSGDAQKKTASSVPLNQLTAEHRLRAKKILDGCSQYRRLPSLQYAIDEPIYRYFLQHPDVAVSTWRVMGISRFEMWQTGPQVFEAQAIDGSEGVVDILYQDPHQMLLICDGNYHNPLLPKALEASALIWLRLSCSPNAEGSQTVTQKADVFVRFPSPGVSAVAKMLSPVTNSMMDRNLFEVSLYGSMMSRAVRDEPGWIVQVAEQMEGVLPQRKGELISIARQPRPSPMRGTTQRPADPQLDRNLIMSPQLLFFDPTKETPSVAGDSSAQQKSAEVVRPGRAVSASATPAIPASSPSGVTIIPAAKTSRTVPNAGNGIAGNGTAGIDNVQTEKQIVPRRSEMTLQPAVPPVGPTATGPAGSGPATSGIR